MKSGLILKSQIKLVAEKSDSVGNKIAMTTVLNFEVNRDLNKMTEIYIYPSSKTLNKHEALTIHLMLQCLH